MKPKKDDVDFSHFSDLSPLEMAGLRAILDGLARERQVDFEQYRHKCLRRRIMVRMSDHNITSFAEYSRFLKKTPEEYKQLLETIAINVSEFFRNPETFAAVRRLVIPELFGRKRKLHSSVLRVWSAGCAGGEEPYSVAAMLAEESAKSPNPLKIMIFATDIDQDALQKAQDGLYAEHALKNLSQKDKETYFVKVDDKKYRIKPELRAMVRFTHHNMIDDPPLERIDMIFCRNVTIYFSKKLQEQVYRNFHKALAAGGYLVAGKVETLIGICGGLFERVDLEERIFRKKGEQLPRDYEMA